MDYKGVVIFINEQIKQDTPTDVILKKIDYMNKLPILKKLFLKKRLAATDPLWKKIDNKTRLNRLFKRYERDYYTDPSQTLFSKLKRKLTRIPSEQKAIDLFGNLYSKEQALERKCIRLIEKIYKHV